MVFNDQIQKFALCREKGAWWRRILSTMSLLFSVLIIVVLAAFSDHGFDLTDEGFYLNWISDPSYYSASVNQFGFVYFPLFRLVDGDLKLLRVINELMLVLGGFICTWSFLGRFAQGIDRQSRRLLAAGLAPLALAYFDLWLLTPSYNSLNLFAVFCVWVGIACSRTEHPWSSSVASILCIGIGMALVFFAKPPTLLAMALCYSLSLSSAL